MMFAADRFWDAHPRRLLTWCDEEEGRCVVLRPKLGRSRWGTWLAGYLRDPYYRIRLDEVGTFVWKACDGQTSLVVIVEQMREQFGDTVEPAEQRLSAFVHRMLRSRLLEIGSAQDM